MTDVGDDLLGRVVDELRTLPPLDEVAVRRIVDAARGGAVPQVRGLSRWRSRVPLAAAAGMALAAGLAGFFVANLARGGPTAPAAGVARTAAERQALVTTAHRAPRTADLPVPTQFILDAPRASRVALVGDFNGWDTAATPLTRDPSSGIWTTTVPLPSGRHVYAYMVDGRRWTLDPRAPTAQDPDFGTPSSVVLVGTP